MSKKHLGRGEFFLTYFYTRNVPLAFRILPDKSSFQHKTFMMRSNKYFFSATVDRFPNLKCCDFWISGICQRRREGRRDRETRRCHRVWRDKWQKIEMMWWWRRKAEMMRMMVMTNISNHIFHSSQLPSFIIPASLFANWLIIITKMTWINDGLVTIMIILQRYW